MTTSDDELKVGVWYRPESGRTPRMINLIQDGMVQYVEENTLSFFPLSTSVAEFKAWAEQKV